VDERSYPEALSCFTGKSPALRGLLTITINPSPPVHPCDHELTQLFGNDTADGKSIIAIVQGDVSIIVRVEP
jgi:hypothetical protein